MHKTLLSEIIKSHKVWLDTDGREGKQANFYAQNLEEIDLENFDLRYAIFSKTKMIRVKIINCNLQGSDFQDADLSYSYCKNSDFSHSNLKNTNFDGSTILDSNFKKTKLDKTNFYKVKTINLDFSDSEGMKINFSNAQLINANFSNIVYNNAQFKSSNITNTLFVNATLINNYLQDSIGVPKESEIQEIDENLHGFISQKPISNLISKFSNVFYALSALIFVVLLALSFFKDKTLEINYLSWAIFIISLIFIATLARAGKYIIIRNDKMKKQDYDNE